MSRLFSQVCFFSALSHSSSSTFLRGGDLGRNVQFNYPKQYTPSVYSSRSLTSAFLLLIFLWLGETP